MDYVASLEYELYVESVMEEQSKIERYVHEALILSEGTNVSERMEVLTEGVGQSIKNGWRKFVAWLKKTWAKFLEFFSHLLSSNKTWLEQYKDIILKKAPKDYTVDMPDYDEGVKNILKTDCKEITVDDCNAIFDNINTDNNGDPKANARETLMGINSQSIKSLTDLYTNEFKIDILKTDLDDMNDIIKKYFLGGESRKVAMNTLNFTDMYNFCYENETLMASLRKAKTALENSCDNIIKYIETTYTSQYNAALAAQQKDAQQKAAAKNAAKTSTPTDNRSTTSDALSKEAEKEAKEAENVKATTNNKSDSVRGPGGGIKVNNASYYFDLLDKQMSLNEIEITSNGNSNSNNNDNDGSFKSNAKNKENIGGANKADEYSAAGSAKGTADGYNAGANAQMLELRLGAFKNVMNCYKDLLGKVLTGEMNAATKIYKDYMDILRTHVRDYVGVTDTSSDRTKQQGTQYGNNANDNNNQQAAAPAGNQVQGNGQQ